MTTYKVVIVALTVAGFLAVGLVSPARAQLGQILMADCMGLQQMAMNSKLTAMHPTARARNQGVVSAMKGEMDRAIEVARSASEARMKILNEMYDGVAKENPGVVRAIQKEL